ncbi:MAG: efflux RND transporter permease subunit [Candidatus Delongbacteria bacterium]|nr:efflux RND transporter permease subunit [Candidatus Delongbacteria bacterium]MBN2834956.1 efflux RND transporter permease subunit [Candidatus Delongbacteria bacterium]
MLDIIIKRPITVIMLFIAVVVFGFISFKKLPVNLLPDVNYPSITIWTEYPGYGPEEVESEITTPLEAQIGSIQGMKKTKSISSTGISLIKADFEWGTDMDFAIVNLREKLDRVSLPDKAERSNIVKSDPTEEPVIGLSVSGKNLFAVREVSENVIKKRLEQLEGVSLADIVGGEEKEIRVKANLEKLISYNVTFDELKNAITSSNVDQAGGTVKDDVYIYDLKISSSFETLDDISSTPVKYLDNGEFITVSDLASVELSTKEKKSFTRYNGLESVGIMIQKSGEANAVEVSKEVKNILVELRESYPQLSINIAFDQADFINDSIDSVTSAVLYGGILAFITLFFFLKDFKTPINIALSIPVSIIATFALLYFSGVSINLISLSGLALGVGMLVDNSIVILENISRHREMGKNALEAAIIGTKEVVMPVTASTLTTIIVFMPIVFISGVAGEIFTDQSIAVTFSLISSLAVSVTLLPVLYSKLMSGIATDSERVIDRSASFEQGKFMKLGTYWTSIITILSLLFYFIEVGEDLELIYFSICFAILIDPLMKFFEFVLFKKQNETQCTRLRYFTVNKLTFIISLLILLPVIYTTRIDIFEPIYRLSFLLNNPEFLRPVLDFLNEITYFIQDLFRPFEEDLGTNLFMTITYSIGVLYFITYLFGMYYFNFLRKLNKEHRDSLIKMDSSRKLIKDLLKHIILFFVGSAKFWWIMIRKSLLAVIQPVLNLFEIGFSKFSNWYHNFLQKVLRYPHATLFLTLIVLIISIFGIMKIQKRLLPDIDSGEFIIKVEMPPQTSLERNEEIVKTYEHMIVSDSSLVHSVFTSGGAPDEKSKIKGAAIYKSELKVLLNNGVSTADYVDNIRPKLLDFNNLQKEQINIEFVTEVSTLSDFLNSEGNDLEVKISGNNFDLLMDVSKIVTEKLNQISDLSEVNSNFVFNKPQVLVKFQKQNLIRYNITPSEINSFITTILDGSIVSEMESSDEKVDIVVKDLNNYYNVNMLYSATYKKNGNLYPLNELITLDYTTGPENIYREDQKRVITVSADIHGDDFSEVFKKVEKLIDDVPKYQGVKVEVSGENSEMKDSFSELIFIFILSLALVYMVLASQFESLLSPFIIILSVPFSIIGVTIGLFLFGQSLNIMSVIGIIVLIGIVVNDAIVKVEFIDRQIRDGSDIYSAILEAGNKRLRPILMTTITTVFGMVPMLVSIGGSSELRQPLAVTVIFGLSFSTMLTLFVIPAIYLILKKGRVGRQETT